MRQDFAVVGISCRLPKSNSPEEFFQALLEGADCVQENSRWNMKYYNAKERGVFKIPSSRAGLVDNFFTFDNEAFNISKKEAEQMDPQQKILLELALDALEDSNIAYRGTSTGVFVGIGHLGFFKQSSYLTELVNGYTSIGSSFALHANRISNRFDLRGPCFGVDSACNSGGNALFVAMRAMMNKDCDCALVGAVNTLLDVNSTVSFGMMGALSPDGKSKSFDASANGYVRSEGCAFIVVKPLEQAIKDNNHIYCVIKSCTSNMNGQLSPSITRPSGEAQMECLRSALRQANLKPSDIYYVEAHGTGTIAGDPIEANALGEVLSEGRDKNSPIRLGSVKSNIGHTEWAAFMASIVKCSIMFDRGTLVPSIHFKKPNPKIAFDKYNIKVQTEVEKFEPEGKRMAILSFGLGGSNSCCIVEGYKNKKRESKWKLTGPGIFIAAALSKPAVDARIKQYKEFPVKDQHQFMYTVDTLYTPHYKFISYGIGETISGAKFSEPIMRPQKKPTLCMVFSGQGPQTINMGRVLYKQFPVFKATIDKCEEIMKKYTGVSLLDDIGMFDNRVEKPERFVSTLNRPLYSTPALIFVQLALYDLWKSFGLVPDVVMGHSLGELAAMYASEVLDLEDTVKILCTRANLMEKLRPVGGMIALGCSEEKAREMIKKLNLENCYISAINSPISVTVGGVMSAIDALDKEAEKENIFHRRLVVKHAYHTPLLSELKELDSDAFERILREARKKTPKLLLKKVFVSTVTGKFWDPDKEIDGEYFWRNVFAPVSFYPAVSEILKKYGEDTVFVEVCCHPVLSVSMKQIGVKNILPSMNRRENEQYTLLNSIGKAVGFGYQLNWDNILGIPENGRVKYLPPYPFQRTELWVEPENLKEERLVTTYDEKKVSTLIGRKQLSAQPMYRMYMTARKFPYLKDHVVQGAVIFPAAGYAEIAMEVLGPCIENFEIERPMAVPVEEKDGLLVVDTIQYDDHVECLSRKEGQIDQPWQLHFKAKKGDPMPLDNPVENVSELLKKCSKSMNKKICYKRFDSIGLTYGPQFQCIETMYQGDEVSFCILDTSHLENLDSYLVHPALLDCSLQCILGAVQSTIHTYLPTGMNHLQVFDKIPSGKLYVFTEITSMKKEKIYGDIKCMNEEGKVLFFIRGAHFGIVHTREEKNEKVDHFTVHYQTKRFPDVTIKPVYGESFDRLKKVENCLEIIDKAVATYIKSGLEELQNVPDSYWAIERKRHLDWCRNFLEKYKDSTGEEWIEKLKTIPHFELETSLIERSGSNFAKLQLNKHNELHDIMFGDDLLDNIYVHSTTFWPYVELIAKCVEQTMAQIGRRAVRIVELGSGTGGLAALLFPLLEKYKHDIEYYFTDVSMAFLKRAEKKFEKFNFVKYKLLDIEKSYAEQGIINNSVDIILGYDVVHVAPKLRLAIKNLYDALVPNGLCALIEVTNPWSFLHLVFGNFEGWWHMRDDRKICALTRDQWKELLSETGFNTVECFGSVDLQSVILARKNETYKDTTTNNVTVFKSSDKMELLKLMHKKIEEKDQSPLIIVTKDASMEIKSNEYAPIVGMGRCYANEKMNHSVRLLDLPGDMSEKEEQFWIDRVKNNIDSFELETVVRNGKAYVPRYMLVHGLKDEKEFKPEKDTKYKLVIENPGKLSSLIYRTFDTPVMKSDEVIIKVMASAVNFKDVLIATNQLQVDKMYRFLGKEFSGVVVSVADGVKGFKPGDEVFGLGKECFGNYAITENKVIAKKPKNISFEEATSIPIVFITAYYALVVKAGINKGDRVLIHSAAGGLGQAAVQIANWRGAIVYATVGSEEKRQFLREKYGVKYFADSHSKTWDRELLQQSEGKRMNIVLNTLSDDNIERGLDILDTNGVFVELGKRDIMQNTRLGMKYFAKNISLISFDLEIITFDPRTQDTIQSVLLKLTSLFEKGILKPIVGKVYTPDRVQDAFEFMRGGKHIGKQVIKFGDLIPSNIKPTLFDSNKTYVLSGGLGAVGFEVAKWMSWNGASHIVLLSRSARLSKYQEREFSSFKERHINVHISKTDVTKDVDSLFKELEDMKFPPVKGIIHLAMVLDDDAIELITPERFYKVYNPKVIGAQNLVSRFKPKDLDFIIFFSSFSSVSGNPNQVNYVAANSFLDRYAQLLTNQGYKAHVINMGAVGDVGVLATDFLVRMTLQAKGWYSPIYVSEICTAIHKILLSDVVQHIPLPNVLFTDSIPIYSHFSHLIKYQPKKTTETSVSEVTEENISKAISQLLDVQSIDPKQPLVNYGADSLLSVDISVMLKQKFGIAVSQMEILGGLTIQQIKKKAQLA